MPAENWLSAPERGAHPAPLAPGHARIGGRQGARALPCGSPHRRCLFPSLALGHGWYQGL